MSDPDDLGGGWKLGKNLQGNVLSIKETRNGKSNITYHDEKNRIIKSASLEGDGNTSTYVWQGDVLKESSDTIAITSGRKLIVKIKYFYGIDNCLTKLETSSTSIEPQGMKENFSTKNYSCQKTENGYKRLKFESDAVVTSIYDKSGKIIDQKTKLDKNSEPTYGYSFEYNYSPPELPESTHMIWHSTDGNGNKGSVISNEYFDKYGQLLAQRREDGWYRVYYENIDKNGNWTTKREVSGSGKTMITTREIEYR